MLAQASKSSNLEGNTLASLSTECLGCIVRFLYYRDLKALHLVGSLALRTKLPQAVTEIRAVLSSLQSWPISAFIYPHLRHLSVSTTSDYDSLPIKVPNNIYIPQEGHSMLESLYLHTDRALAFLRSTNVQSLLPNVTSLEICSLETYDISIFQTLPSHLSYLKLELIELGHTYTMQDLHHLFPTLQTLIIIGVTLGPTVSETSKQATFVGAFPSGLIHLKASLSSNADIFTASNVFPQTLQYLFLHTYEVFKLCTSILPQSLTHLDIDYGMAHPEVIFDVPLPTSLTCCMLPLKSRLSVPGYDSVVLVDWLSQHVVQAEIPSQTSQKPLPYEVLLSIFRTVEIPDDPIPVIHLMRPGSTLYLSHSELPENEIASIPNYVTRMSASIDDGDVWKNKILNLKNLSFLILDYNHPAVIPSAVWSILHGRLQELTCTCDHFDSRESLLGPWKYLKSLALRRTPMASSSSSSGLLPIESEDLIPYPAGLEALTLQINFSCSSVTSRYVQPIAQLKHLKSLSVAYDSSSNNDYTYLEALPSNIRDLKCYVPHDVSPELVHQLPKSIRKLVLHAHVSSTIAVNTRGFFNEIGMEEYPHPSWRDAHVEHLPPYLESLWLYGVCLVTHETLKRVLPPTVADVVLGGQTVEEALTEAMRLKKERERN